MSTPTPIPIETTPEPLPIKNDGTPAYSTLVEPIPTPQPIDEEEEDPWFVAKIWGAILAILMLFYFIFSYFFKKKPLATPTVVQNSQESTLFGKSRKKRRKN